MSEPERNLAAAVINQAITDFGGWPDRLRPDDTEAPTVSFWFKSSIQDKLRRLYQQIQAGEFLLERSDRITRFWFALAGVDRPSIIAMNPGWRERLAMLRAAVDHLRAKAADEERKAWTYVPRVGYQKRRASAAS